MQLQLYNNIMYVQYTTYNIMILLEYKRIMLQVNVDPVYKVNYGNGCLMMRTVTKMCLR